MVTEYGMSDKLGPMQYGQSQGGNVFLGRDIGSEQNYSDKIAYEIDQEMMDMIKEQYQRTKQILTERRELLDLIANTLLKKETLDARDIKHLEDHGRLPEPLEEEQEPETTESTPDSTGAPYDPSSGDLPQEDGTNTEAPQSPIREDRKGPGIE